MAKKKRKPAKRKIVKALPKTITERGKRYTKAGCGLNKAGAKKAAQEHRDKKPGNGAIRKKDPKTGKWCYFTRGK